MGILRYHNLSVKPSIICSTTTHLFLQTLVKHKIKIVFEFFAHYIFSAALPPWKQNPKLFLCLRAHQLSNQNHRGRMHHSFGGGAPATKNIAPHRDYCGSPAASSSPGYVNTPRQLCSVSALSPTHSYSGRVFLIIHGPSSSVLSWRPSSSFLALLPPRASFCGRRCSSGLIGFFQFNFSFHVWWRWTEVVPDSGRCRAMERGNAIWDNLLCLADPRLWYVQWW